MGSSPLDMHSCLVVPCGLVLLVVAGCESGDRVGGPQAQEEASELVVAPLPQLRVVRCSKAARGGELPPGEEEMPRDYEQFRSSDQYRITLRTWRDENLLSSAGQRSVVICLSEQRGQCFVDGQLAMDFPVCTGTSSHPTPTGCFRVSEKDRHHRSNLYHCSMPLFMRLTDDGIGLHVGDVFRAPASHGCIRLTREACATLFRDLPHGARVDVLP